MKEIISSSDTWRIVKRTLDRVDPRLVEHGDRVAFIIERILLSTGQYDSQQITHAALLALLHDIGAYKTDEIDHMVEFETGHVWEHSIYGYLFLKQLSPLSSSAQVILYHHLNVSEFDRLDIPQDIRRLSELIKMADRIDILMGTMSREEIIRFLKQNRGIRFAADWVDAFCEADRDGAIIAALQNGEYHCEMKRFVDRISLTDAERRQFLRLVAYVIDFRSECMVRHTVTTVAISNAIAVMMHLADEEVAKIGYGALLHDLGKIAIPIEILEKPDRLSFDEMEIMKQHVTIGGEILKDYIDPDIYQIAVRHHEKMDGSGYPLGLTGKDLTLGERIVAIADITSALLRKRSYKEAFDRSSTADILSQLAQNNKICPAVAGLVLKNFDPILDEAEKQSVEVLVLYDQMKREYAETLRHVVELDRHLNR